MIENERKYLLRGHAVVEASMAALAPGIDILQGYLDGSSRIRRYLGGGCVWTVKGYRPDGRNDEDEREITDARFNEMWPSCKRSLAKRRYKVSDGPDVTWDVDFFTSPDMSVYFAMAEAEMPEDMEEPPRVLSALGGHVAFLVPRRDMRFSSSKLCDVAYASALAAGYGASS